MLSRLFVLSTAMAIGCGVDNSPLDTGMCGLAASEVEQGSYVDSTVRWPKKKVSVCWINPQNGSNKDRQLVQLAVTEGWDKHIDLDYIWSEQPCGGCEDVRILIRDQRPHALVDAAKYLRTNLIPSIVLNFTFKEWGSACNIDENVRRECIMRATNHEFGHNLGFIHEQNRPDTPYWCVSWLDPDSLNDNHGDVMSPEWDKDSIMNYCAHAFMPSPMDVLTAQKIYGVEQDR